MDDLSPIADPRVRFSMPAMWGGEIPYVTQALEAGHLHGDGPFTARCAELLEKLHGCARVLLTPSCTHALELAVMLLNLNAGDEVIVPSFTFPSTATAVVRAGATPVFVDVRPDTLDIDIEQVRAALTERTRAVIPVHYNGVGCDMEDLGKIAERHGLDIIEDNAQGLFGRYRGRLLGTFGALGCLSFHATKNFTSGEGGALLINDPALIDRAERIREKGTNRRAFLEGRVDKYTWVDVGSSYLPSDIQAAILLAQLEKRVQIQDHRQGLWDAYNAGLAPLAAKGVRLPTVPADCEQSYHLFYIITRSPEERSGVLEHARARGIDCSFHYQPLHASEAGRRYGRAVNDCPNTNFASECLVRLPLHSRMTERDQVRVIAAILEYYERNTPPGGVLS